MNWLNLELTTLRSEEYLGADPVQRATWLNLLAYCADQENGGTIKNCADWNDRKWMQLVGVTYSEILSSCDLWNFKNESISVVFYPKAKEREVKAKRNAGKKGGRPPKTKDEKPSGLTELKPSKSEAETEGNRKGIGKEEEIEGNKNNKKQSRQSPPSLSEVIKHAQLKAIGNPAPYITRAKEAHAFYSGNMREMGVDVWKDGNGNTVKNWKLKLNNVWFSKINPEVNKPRAI